MESLGEGKQEREKRHWHMYQFGWSKMCVPGAVSREGGHVSGAGLRKTQQVKVKNSGFPLKAEWNKYHTCRKARKKKAWLGVYRG